MKRYIVPMALALTGVSMFVIGSVSAEPPYAEPIDDVQPIIHDAGTFEMAPPTTSDGVPYIIHDVVVTTPQHDQCWSNETVTNLMESGTFVIYGNDDPRRWGTHSIGGMNCGPADLPFPEPAPEPALALAAEVVAVEPEACNP